MLQKKILVKRTDMPDFDEYVKLIEKLWQTRWITNNGEYAKRLANELKKYLCVPNLALLCNGTLSLHIALKILDLPQGGEIITTPFTFIATTNVIIWEGYIPVFVDIDPKTWNIDPTEIEKAITPNTVAIMPVHVYGNPCDVEAIDIIAKKHNLKIIYDAAHAFGVKYRDQSILNYGDLSSLSFHATKVFHTIEGGALVSGSKELIAKVENARNFGIVEYEDLISAVGTNAKMNEFQAAMGLCNIANLGESLILRKKIYESYRVKLKKYRKVRFQKITASEYNYAYMPICFESMLVRDRVTNKLEEINVFPRKYFYPLSSDIPMYQKYNRHASLAKARSISDGILCLPLYGELTEHDISKVVKIIIQNI